jgi:hypothetical protein
MPPLALPEYESPQRTRLIPWHAELRFTLFGIAAGIIAGSLTLFSVFYGHADHFWPVPYCYPVAYQLTKLFVPPFPVLILFCWLVGGLCEWVIWGLIVDACRAFSRSRRRQSGVA